MYIHIFVIVILPLLTGLGIFILKKPRWLVGLWAILVIGSCVIYSNWILKIVALYGHESPHAAAFLKGYAFTLFLCAVVSALVAYRRLKPKKAQGKQ